MSRNAIWNRHPAVLVASAASILTQVGLLVYSVTIATDVWGAGAQHDEGCFRVNIVQASLPALMATFIIDALLLLLMLIGLFLRREACRFGLGGLLLKQGLIWLVVAITAELPTVVRRHCRDVMNWRDLYTNEVIDHPQFEFEWCVWACLENECGPRY